jgi:hypothetical protein
VLRIGLQKAQDLEVVFFLKGGKSGGVHWVNADEFLVRELGLFSSCAFYVTCSDSEFDAS